VISHIEEHSRKPLEVHRRIERLMGDVPKIELFARRKTAGFDVWGNEVESDISLYNTEVEDAVSDSREA
jgi:N6-adenosine-specific RNA methylase IME4